MLSCIYKNEKNDEVSLSKKKSNISRLEPFSDTAWIVERIFRARGSLAVPVGEEFLFKRDTKVVTELHKSYRRILINVWHLSVLQRKPSTYWFPFSDQYRTLVADRFILIYGSD